MTHTATIRPVWWRTPPPSVSLPGPAETEPDPGLALELDCEPPTSFEARVAIAASVMRFADSPDSANFDGFDAITPTRIGAVSQQWERYLAEWWLTGMPRKQFGSRTPTTISYGTHVFQTSGFGALSFSEVVQIASMLDAMEQQADTIGQYFDVQGIGTANWFGRATVGALRERRVFFVKWTASRQQQYLDDPNGPTIAAAKDLFRPGSISSQRDRDLVNDFSPPEGADYMILLPEQILSGRAGEWWDQVNTRQFALPFVTYPLCADPVSADWQPPLTATASGAWELPRNSTEPAAVILTHPKPETLAVSTTDVWDPFGLPDGGNPRTSWLTVYSTLVHEMMHLGYFELGVYNVGVVECVFDGPAVAAGSGLWPPSSRHDILNLAADQVAESFVWGSPNGILYQRNCVPTP